MSRTLKRRRKEGKTDYRLRLNLLKSGKPRLVIRKSNQYMLAQIIESEGAQDKVLYGLTSKALLSKGWPVDLSGSLKSIQASYLTGLMLGNVAKSKVKFAVLDIGLYRNIEKSRIYALLKGILDAGISIPHSEEILPSLEEISKKGKGGEVFTKVKQKIQNG
ncbi:MAG: 50S ribosomal protein L18 [Nanoarchaeota archaeon]